MTMRLLYLTISFFLFSSFQNDNMKSVGHEITFIKVDLVCGAASDIGCGSRSKPILIDLEEQTEIAEAWLNRPGTIIAVVWENDRKVDKNILQQILKNHKKSGKILTEIDSIVQHEKFNSERWYRTTEVDELSVEEAGRIAEMVISAIKDQGSLGDENASLMQVEVEEFIKNELLSLEDVNLLNKRSYYKGWETGIKRIATSYMEQSEVDKIHLFVMSPWIKYLLYGGASVLLLMSGYLLIKWRNKISLKNQGL